MTTCFGNLTDIRPYIQTQHKVQSSKNGIYVIRGQKTPTKYV